LGARRGTDKIPPCRDFKIASIKSLPTSSKRLAGFVALVAVEVIYFRPSDPNTGWMTYGGIALLFVLYMGAYLWAWNEPGRQLRGRGARGRGPFA
jgi:hypothetical protein